LRRLGALALLGVALLQSAGCRKTSEPREQQPPTPASARQATPIAVDGRLPEDPVAGQKSTAEWREHLAEEERERKLGYDRRKLAQHRALLALLRSARARYEGARSEPEVLSARARMPALSVEARRRIADIDHWGVNSNLLTDYGAMLDALAEPYAQAKLASLRGEAAPLDAQRAAFDAHEHEIETWLAEAGASKDE